MASAAAAAEWEAAERKVLVARKPCFGLPTACPTSLPVLLYLRMAQVPFDIHVDTSFPDAGELPDPTRSPTLSYSLHPLVPLPVPAASLPCWDPALLLASPFVSC
jgi:hypothetical protein